MFHVVMFTATFGCYFTSYRGMTGSRYVIFMKLVVRDMFTTVVVSGAVGGA